MWLWRLRSPRSVDRQARDRSISSFLKAKGKGEKKSQLKHLGRRNTPHWTRVRVSVLFSPFTDCLRPIPTREDRQLFPDYQFRYSVHPEIPSQTHPEMMFDQLGRLPLTQSNWNKINHLREEIKIELNISTGQGKPGARLPFSCKGWAWQSRAGLCHPEPSPPKTMELLERVWSDLRCVWGSNIPWIMKIIFI